MDNATDRAPSSTSRPDPAHGLPAQAMSKRQIDQVVAESIQVLRWAEEAGAYAVHVSTGNFFLHPLNPAGNFTPTDAIGTYDTMLSSGRRTLRNYPLWRFGPTRPSCATSGPRTVPRNPEGLLLSDAEGVRRHLSVPVIVTGGFQNASVVREAVLAGRCDAVSLARPLMANPDLVNQWAAGADRPERRCTYCNLCLFHVLEDPLGCYDIRRDDGDHDWMIKAVMSIYRPDGWSADPVPPAPVGSPPITD